LKFIFGRLHVLIKTDVYSLVVLGAHLSFFTMSCITAISKVQLKLMFNLFDYNFLL